MNTTQAIPNDLTDIVRRAGYGGHKVFTLLRQLLCPTLHRPGPAVRKYEAAYEHIFPGAKAFAFWKGRVGLYAILRGLGIGEGDEILIPGYTCVVVAGASVYTGARPVYVDIDPKDYNIDPDLLDLAVSENTKALIVQHTYGFPARMDRLMDWASRHNLPVIEDACHALGCQYNGKLLGTFGVASFFSSQWNKHYPTALGGVALVNDPHLADRVRKLCEQEMCPPSCASVWMLAAQMLAHHLLVFPRTLLTAQALFRWLTARGLVVGSATSQELTNQRPENYLMAMSEIQARVGLFELARLRKNLAHRARLSTFYAEQLGNEPHADTSQPLVRYPLRVKDRAACLEEAVRHRIEIGTWFECPLHPQETDHAQFGYTYGTCPEGERAAGQVVNLPVHLRVSPKYARRVAKFAHGHALNAPSLPEDEPAER